MALAHAGLLTLFATAGEPTVALVRPALVVTFLILVLQAVLTVVLRNGMLAALLLAAAMITVAGLWPLAIALIAVPAWWLLIATLRRSRGAEPPPREPLFAAHGLLNTFATLLFVVVTLWALLGGAFRLYPPPAPASGQSGTPNMPNVYLVLLDGYPSPVTLDGLGLDAAGLVDGLASLGFESSAGARSNYSQTWPTLASMFQMTYLVDAPSLQGVPADLGEQRRRLTALINSGPAVDAFRAAGYRVVTHTSPFSSVSLLAADEVHTPGFLNEYEELLLRKSGALALLGDSGERWVVAEARAWIESSIDAIADTQGDGPAFVFHHVMAPHPPFLFEGDGSAPRLRACYPRDCPFWVTELGGTETDPAGYRDALDAELTYLNARLMESISELVAQDPEAVIVLFADHGLRVDETDVEEHFSVFFAARTPGHAQLFSSDPSLVNLLPALLNAYAGMDLPLRDYAAWRSGLLPLDLTPVTGP